MRAAALEIIGIARAENAPLVVNGDLETTGQDDAAFLSFMH